MARIATPLGHIGFEEHGRDDDGTPIVFLHGVGSDRTVWRPQLDHFGRSRRTVAFDYPGYYESDLIAGATRDDFAAAILAAMTALGIEQAHVCGLSLGGVVAIAMHDAAPNRCASLIIADSFAAHPDGQAIHDRSVAASEAMSMAELAAARAPMLLGKAASDELKREVIATMGRIDPEAYRLGAEAVWLADQRDRAALIAVPTLILVGDEDAITPPALSDELQRLIASSRLEVLPDAGHLANAEQAGPFNDAVDRHLAGLDQTA